jgi:hypothetical protein
MMRVIAVITKAGSEVVEYVVLEDGRYPSLDAFLEAARGETRDLAARHGLPNDELEQFDGSDRSVESFFHMFPNLKLTPRSVRSTPREPPARCACPGCRNEAPGGGRTYCPACEEEVHIAHCRHCGAALFSLNRPCPACGTPIDPGRQTGG